MKFEDEKRLNYLFYYLNILRDMKVESKRTWEIEQEIATILDLSWSK